jgi:membrane-associated phospholipid phosphatase
MLRLILLSIFLALKIDISAQPYEVQLLRTINEHSRPTWDAGMSHLSFSAYPVVSLVPIAIWAHGFGRKDDKMMNNGYKSAITIGSALAISSALKILIERDRPYVTYKKNIVMRDSSGPHSFPSGHTTGAFSAATAMSLSYRKWYVTVPSYLYAGFVAYSRMRLGVHYPTDVLGGMVLGIGSGLLTWKIDQMIKEKKAREKQEPVME